MSGTDDLALQYARDVEALRNLGPRYARAADARDYETMAELFHPDAVVQGLRGEAAIYDYLESMRATPAAYEKSMHMFANPTVMFTAGTDEATLDTYAVVYQIGAHDGGGNVTLGMRYFDDVERRDGAWRLRHRRTELLWMTAS